MSETIHIEMTAEARALLAAAKAWPAGVMQAVEIGMDRQNALTVAHIQKAYLSFPKGGPPSDIGLRVQSNRLRGAAWASPAVVTGTMVTSSIGDNVSYARIHELGGTIHHPARQVTVRHRTDAHGELMRQAANANLLVFAKRGHKRARESTHQAAAHDVEMPARGMFRRGVTDRLADYGREISAAVVGSLGSKV